MECKLHSPPPDLFVTTGNRGTLFPNLDCPIETAVRICPLIIQEGEEYVLYLETGDFLLMPCDL
jgi:hypothetical protein